MINRNTNVYLISSLSSFLPSLSSLVGFLTLSSLPQCRTSESRAFLVLCFPEHCTHFFTLVFLPPAFDLPILDCSCWFCPLLGRHKQFDQIHNPPSYERIFSAFSLISPSCLSSLSFISFLNFQSSSDHHAYVVPLLAPMNSILVSTTCQTFFLHKTGSYLANESA